MPKLPALNFKRLVKILEANDFDVDHATGSHYILYNKINGKRVTVPFHNKELPKGTLMSIIKQAGLSKEDLI